MKHESSPLRALVKLCNLLADAYYPLNFLDDWIGDFMRDLIVLVLSELSESNFLLLLLEEQLLFQSTISVSPGGGRASEGASQRHVKLLHLEQLVRVYHV